LRPEIALILNIMARPKSVGPAKYQKKSWTRKGMFRKTSTYAVPIRLTHGRREILMVPMITPRTRAMIQAISPSWMVSQIPWSSQTP
jgi:hypothetical protein